MKTLVLISVIITFCPAFLCSKNTEEPVAGCYKGKLEAIPNCGGPVVRILEGDLSKINHISSWTSPSTGEIFLNVFTVTNYCHPGENNISEGEEFYFTLSNELDPQNCVICMALFPVPAERNIIKIIPPDLCR